MFVSGSGSSPAITNCTFIGNAGGINVANNALITHCTFTNNTYYGMDVGSGNPTVTNCTFTGNQNDGMLLFYCSATVANCTFNANQRNGVTLAASNTTITNCTFTGNRDSGVRVESGNTGSNVTLTNCILYADGSSELLISNSASIAVMLSHCDVQGGFAGMGNISQNPLFVNAPSDLHLRPGSPCLGAGTANGAPTTDQDGTLRPNPPSIGAYEVTSTPIPGRFDFDGDGHDDLFWHNTSTGQNLVWNMNDQSATTYGVSFATVPNTDWTVAAIADVNGDGHPDLLWQNTRTGQVLFWLMGGTNGQQAISYGNPFATVPDTHWRVVSMADFNGDGHPDILWQNRATDQLVIWYLNGTQVVNYGAPFTTVTNTNWQVVGTADFNSDGHPDFLWENSATGDVLVWNMGGADGTTALNYGSPFATVPNTAWHIVGTGDLNGDSHPDLLWQNVQTGQVLRWLMGGASGTQGLNYGNPFATVPDTHWQIVGVH